MPIKEEHKKIISEEFLDLLQTKYPLAKKGLIDLEVHERLKVLGAFTDLRDVFDHFYLAVNYASDDGIDEPKKIN